MLCAQLWRGFSRAMGEYEIITPAVFSKALTEAKNTAYKGVVRPVEGTILTVLKDTANLYTFNPESYSELKDKGFRLEF